jgi:isopentenyldiphosphate isomerase
MNTLTLTDPHELIEIWTPDGQPTGQGARRGDVHLQGLWHQAFFCWVARPGNREVEILLQHRSDSKDSFPGYFNCSAAGHVRLGESMHAAARELREELGIPDQLEDLVPFGTHRQEHLHASGLIDREYHVLHLLARRIDDSELHPDPREVQGLAWVPGSVLLDLAEGRRTDSNVAYLSVSATGRVTSSRRRLYASEIVPYDGRYHRRIVDLATSTLRERGLLS